MRARVSMLLRSRASPDMLPCSICSKKRLAIRHMNRPLFSTTLSIPSYDNREVHVGRAENWPAPPRTAQIRCAQILKKSRNRLKFYTLDGWNEKKKYIYTEEPPVLGSTLQNIGSRATCRTAEIGFGFRLNFFGPLGKANQLKLLTLNPKNWLSVVKWLGLGFKTFHLCSRQIMMPYAI